jgi:serine phosphatase RsbU (regulator of sigma subunit)
MAQFKTQLALVMSAVVVGAVALVALLLISSSIHVLKEQTVVTGRAYTQMLVTVFTQQEERQAAVPPAPPGRGPGWAARNAMRRLAAHSLGPLTLHTPGTGRFGPPPHAPDPGSVSLVPEQAAEDLAELAHVLGALQMALILEDGTVIPAAMPAPHPLRLDPATIRALFHRFDANAENGMLEQRYQHSVAVMAALNSSDPRAPAAVLIQLPAQTATQIIAQNAPALALILLIIAVTAAVATLGLSRSISTPLTRLVHAAEMFGRGMLTVRAPLGGAREIRTLGHVLNHMASSLQNHITDLQNETRKREQYETELRVAATLQQSLLPEHGVRHFGPFAIAGWNQQAREVGGDFYGYWELSPTRIAIVVGDATGKGITAALLAAQTLSALRSLADAPHDPATVLACANRALSRQFRRERYFATAVLVLLDTQAMTAAIALAGHNPPLLTGHTSNGPVQITSDTGYPLGICDDAVYETITIPLPPGATLLLYTDGVTEAFDTHDCLYGEARLAETFSRHHQHGPEHILANHTHDLAAHRAGRLPSDDATLVLIKAAAPTATESAHDQVAARPAML